MTKETFSCLLSEENSPPISQEPPLLMTVVFLVHLGKKICHVPQLRVIFTQYKERSYVTD